MEGLLSDAAIRETADIAAPVLGWNTARRDAEIAFAAEEMSRRNVRNTRPQKAA